MKKVSAFILCFAILSSSLANPVGLAKQLSRLAKEDSSKLIKAIESKPTQKLTAVLNDYTDKLLKNLNGFIDQQHLNSLPLPDLGQNFSFPLPILPPITGKISLTNGTFKGLDTFYRPGDVTVTYVNKTISIHAPVGLKKVVLDYRYKAQLMGIGPSGGAEATLNNLRITIDLSIDLELIKLALNNFSVDGSGLITVNFTGFILTDLLLEVLSTVVANLVRPIILHQVEQSVQNPIQSVIEQINAAIDDFLNPDSP